MRANLIAMAHQLLHYAEQHSVVDSSARDQRQARRSAFRSAVQQSQTSNGRSEAHAIANAFGAAERKAHEMVGVLQERADEVIE
jgi:hypothetical protein